MFLDAGAKTGLVAGTEDGTVNAKQAPVTVFTAGASFGAVAEHPFTTNIAACDPSLDMQIPNCTRS